MGTASAVWARDHYRQWQRLPQALQASSPSGESYFEGLSDSQVANYQRAISGYARHDYDQLPQVIDWGEHESVIDAGGGQGVLLAQLLGGHSHLEGTLLELPQVVKTVEIPGGLSERFRTAPADFFEPWPVEADAIVLARVLHDWSDADALRILSRARQSLRPGGRLYVIEMVLSGKHPDGSLLDLNMLVMTGGRERTHDDWTRLFTEAGFELLETLALPSVSDILVGGLK
jgi:SAM-dependent methyltransferase